MLSAILNWVMILLAIFPSGFAFLGMLPLPGKLELLGDGIRDGFRSADSG